MNNLLITAQEIQEELNASAGFAMFLYIVYVLVKILFYINLFMLPFYIHTIKDKVTEIKKEMTTTQQTEDVKSLLQESIKEQKELRAEIQRLQSIIAAQRPVQYPQQTQRPIQYTQQPTQQMPPKN